MSSVVEVILEVVIRVVFDLGLEWLLDHGRRRTPWIAIFFAFVITTTIFVLVLFRSALAAWQVWVMSGIIVLLAVFVWLDIWYWRDERKLTKAELDRLR